MKAAASDPGWPEIVGFLAFLAELDKQRRNRPAALRPFGQIVEGVEGKGNYVLSTKQVNVLSRWNLTARRFMGE